MRLPDPPGPSTTREAYVRVTEDGGGFLAAERAELLDGLALFPRLTDNLDSVNAGDRDRTTRQLNAAPALICLIVSVVRRGALTGAREQFHKRAGGTLARDRREQRT